MYSVVLMMALTSGGADLPRACATAGYSWCGGYSKLLRWYGLPLVGTAAKELLWRL